MSQETTAKCAIPPNRSFQQTNISSFTESRRQRFLSFRRHNRELYFEKARKLVLNQDTIGDNNDDNINVNDFSFNKIQFHKDFESNEVSNSTNKYQQYPPANNNNNNSPKSNKKTKKKKKRKTKYNNNAVQASRRKYVDMFMVHEWMIDIPNDITQNWLVGLRAEGERCLVFSTSGGTISRNRSGNFIHNRFPSSLPCGNYIQQKKSSITVLDCIWIKNISTYYVIDCILWNDQHIGSSDACMRLWFIKSKLSECNNIDLISKYNKYRFVSIQTMTVSLENLNYLYSGGNLLNNQNEEKKEEKIEKKEDKKWYKIQPDGLIFYHKNGSYVNALSCPLILIWKDNKISRWFIDTSNRQNKNKLLQFITLQLQRNGTITTHESDIVLSAMSVEEIKKYNFKPNQLLRYSITNAIMDECKVDNLFYIKRASVSKMQADSWSKIVFQHQAKNGQSIQFADIVNVVLNGKNNDGMDGNEWDKDVQNIDDQLRVATLGLSNFHL